MSSFIIASDSPRSLDHLTLTQLAREFEREHKVFLKNGGSRYARDKSQLKEQYLITESAADPTFLERIFTQIPTTTNLSKSMQQDFADYTKQVIEKEKTQKVKLDMPHISESDFIALARTFYNKHFLLSSDRSYLRVSEILTKFRKKMVAVSETFRSSDEFIANKKITYPFLIDKIKRWWEQMQRRDIAPSFNTTDVSLFQRAEQVHQAFLRNGGEGYLRAKIELKEQYLSTVNAADNAFPERVISQLPDTFLRTALKKYFTSYTKQAKAKQQTRSSSMTEAEFVKAAKGFHDKYIGILQGTHYQQLNKISSEVYAMVREKYPRYGSAKELTLALGISYPWLVAKIETCWEDIGREIRRAVL